MESGTALIQYIFLDVVRFTQDRPTEAQADIVGTLNSIVKQALSEAGLADSGRILLPTGDGLCIAIFPVADFAISLNIAESVLTKLSDRNQETEDPKRRFEVRIGINQNVDNVLEDINGHTNVAGRGINMAQRIMSQADGNQILIGDAIHEILREREKFIGAFAKFEAKDKHGTRFPVHQLIQSDYESLNIDRPKAFQIKIKENRKLDAFMTFFVASAIKYREYFVSRTEDTWFDDCSLITIYLLARTFEHDRKRGPHATRIEFAELARSIHPDQS